MTVRKLIQQLQALPPNAVVVCQKDSEGNGYSPLSALDPGTYRPDSTWSGGRVDGEDYEQVPGDKAAVFLIPVN